jgi:hypothetical protein
MITQKKILQSIQNNKPLSKFVLAKRERIKQKSFMALNEAVRTSPTLVASYGPTLDVHI